MERAEQGRVRERVKKRMAEEGIPVGTDSEELLALGAKRLYGCPYDECDDEWFPNADAYLAHLIDAHDAGREDQGACPSTGLAVLGAVDPAGAWVRCGRRKGHDGPHRFFVEWDQ